VLGFLRKGQRWLTGLVVVGVGFVFAVFLGLGSTPQGPSGRAVVEVGGYRFGLREFERIRTSREEQIRQAAGEDFDARDFEGPLNDFAAGVLVNRAILALEADRMGIAVSNREIEDMVRAGSGGSIDVEGFRDFIRREYGTERHFIREERIALQAGKMVRLIQGLPRVSEAEARESLRQRLEEVRIAAVVLDPEGLAGDGEIDPERVAAALAGRDVDLRALYEARAEVYQVPEQVRARHILIRVPPGSEPEAAAEAETRARQALARVRAGEDFARVAAELSEDPGSKDNGGDLGLFGRGRMVAPFEEAAFALAPGTPSDLVRTDFGFHVILVEEHRQAESRPYEAVREELARELLAGEAGRERVDALAGRLSAAVGGGASLEDAARAEGLTLVRTDWLRRRPDGFVPDVGPAPEMLALAFTLEPGQSSARTFQVGARSAMLQVLERRGADPAEIEARIAGEREQLLESKRLAALELWMGQRRQALVDGGELSVDYSAIP